MMHHLSVFLALISATTSSLAAPTPETHFLVKRDAVCGLDFRSLVDHDSCLPNPKVYVLGNNGAPEVVQQTHPLVSTAKLQCDHIVELQLVDKVAKSSGLCEVLSTLQAASPANSKSKMLKNAADSVSNIKNLNFLDNKINNQKKTVVQRILSSDKDKHRSTTALDKAVGNYLAMVKSNGTDVASAIDEDFATIIAIAKDALKDLQAHADSTTVSRTRKNPKTILGDKLKNALEEYEAKVKTNTVSRKFAKVLKNTPRS